MAKLTWGQITLGRTASLLGILQGVAWFGMSLTCIIEFNATRPPQPPETYMEYFNSRVYYFYLYNNAKLPAGTALTPIVFTVFMCVYIVLATVWVVISFFQLNVITKNSVNVPVLFKDWALVTWVISAVDLVLVVLIGSDYNQNCLDNYGDEVCVNTMIPVLVIAARGFVLWFVNVVVAWVLFKNAKLLRKGGSYQGTFGGILPIYRPVSHIPRANVSTEPSLYSQQLSNVNRDKNFWNVNLRTAMDNRTPPVSPTSPSPIRNEEFFSKF